MPQPILGALVYDTGSGGAADILLADTTRTLTSRGFRLAGAIQHNIAGDDGCLCDMTLEDLTSGSLISISEKRGPLARGCRLDTAALEHVVGLATGAVEGGADMLIVNKFGKREAEGHGLRQVIEAAVGRGIPVLVAVSAGNLAAWNDFTGGLDTRLPLDPQYVATWCADVLARPGASAPTRSDKAASAI